MSALTNLSDYFMTEEMINSGVSFGESQNIHLNALYDIRRRIASVIESAGITHNTVDYDIVQSLVENAISLIPDSDQAKKCQQLMNRYEEEEGERIAAENNHEHPTTDDRQRAKKAASFAILNILQIIYDEDIGIRRQFTIGVA